jgi:hypothetical protein
MPVCAGMRAKLPAPVDLRVPTTKDTKSTKREGKESSRIMNKIFGCDMRFTVSWI